MWQCRIAPSLGNGFAGTPNEVWGTVDYQNDEAPTVFFGLYGLPDFYALWRHKGRKAILWAGSDIRHLVNGYFLDEKGSIKMSPYPLATWINKYCENWVENQSEWEMLKSVGIDSKICPSFLGDVNGYEVSFKPGNKVYSSVSGDDFELYGWKKIEYLAKGNPNIQFYLYGNKKEWPTKQKNVIVRGRVSQEQMNSEIKEMQGCLRLIETEGFSEIVAKAYLYGQYPISTIDYPFSFKPEQIGQILEQDKPNILGREWLLQSVNKYPFNAKI